MNGAETGETAQRESLSSEQCLSTFYKNVRHELSTQASLLGFFSRAALGTNKPLVALTGVHARRSGEPGTVTKDGPNAQTSIHSTAGNGNLISIALFT